MKHENVHKFLAEISPPKVQSKEEPKAKKEKKDKKEKKEKKETKGKVEEVVEEIKEKIIPETAKSE